MARICVWGCSIALGHNDASRGGWAERIRLDVMKRNKHDSLYNCSISSDTSRDLVKRFDAEYAARKPYLVLIAIGLGDSAYFKKKTKPQVDIATYENNLDLLYKKAKKNSKVIFVGITQVDESKTMPVPWRKELYYSNDMIAKYNEVIKKFCAKNRIPFIDMSRVLTLKDLDDGLHPTSKGHEKMYLVVKKFLEKNKFILLK